MKKIGLILLAGIALAVSACGQGAASPESVPEETVISTAAAEESTSHEVEKTAASIADGTSDSITEVPHDERQTWYRTFGVSFDEETGWCYVFERQAFFNPEDDDDRYIPYGFYGVNLRYNYDPNYVTVAIRETTSKRYREVYAYGALVFGDGSAAQAHDMEIISKLLSEKRPIDEMMSLKESDLDFEVLDAGLFLRLMRECFQSKPHALSWKGLGNLSNPFFLREPYYLDGYKFQFCALNCTGFLDELYFDIRYETGEGYADYVQLSDLVEQGKASPEQLEAWQVLQEIRATLKGSDDLMLDADKFRNREVGGIDFSRLYTMFQAMLDVDYWEYCPDYEIISFQEIPQE